MLLCKQQNLIHQKETNQTYHTYGIEIATLSSCSSRAQGDRERPSKWHLKVTSMHAYGSESSFLAETFGVMTSLTTA